MYVIQGGEEKKGRVEFRRQNFTYFLIFPGSVLHLFNWEESLFWEVAHSTTGEQTESG